MIIQNEGRNYNKNYRTPLHYVLTYHFDKMGELLISKGADINAKDIIYLNRIIFFLINIINNK